ncbi:MAG: hypothetical protein ACOXZ5_05175 [Syntrophomonadaceae bacterium]|jgi:tRNA A-37 threonylcarbamoyl transferase component Bud32
MQDLILLVEQYYPVKILAAQKMFSRRNQVYLVEAITQKGIAEKLVVKINSCCMAQQEACRLRELRQKGIKVPAVKWSNHQIIIMEYIIGTLLEGIINRTDWLNQDKWLKCLVAWLGRLHSIRNPEGQVLCFPDLNLRNFIYTGESIFGLDFEEWVWDRPERDLGGLAAFILNNNPMFTPAKYEVVNRLLKNYQEVNQVDLNRVREHLILEMRRAANRRKEQRKYLLLKIQEMEAGNQLGFIS